MAAPAYCPCPRSVSPSSPLGVSFGVVADAYGVRSLADYRSLRGESRTEFEAAWTECALVEVARRSGIPKTSLTTPRGAEVRHAVLAILADGQVRAGRDIGLGVGLRSDAIGQYLRWMVREGIVECTRKGTAGNGGLPALYRLVQP